MEVTYEDAREIVRKPGFFKAEDVTEALCVVVRRLIDASDAPQAA